MALVGVFGFMGFVGLMEIYLFLYLVYWKRVEIVDRDGKSSLLSLVKAFDSVLAVYEGFCNLKQVCCL